MTIFQCEECRGKVSTKADKCPHCGCPIPVAPPAQHAAGESNSGCAILIVLGLAAWAIYYFFGK